MDHQPDHKLNIVSLHDGMASCICGGWTFVVTGEVTKDQISDEYRSHISRFINKDQFAYSPKDLAFDRFWRDNANTTYSTDKERLRAFYLAGFQDGQRQDPKVKEGE